ncbi:MAG: tRNA pseudouridine(54/55) synthase Pus10 [Methanomicrobiales archaeon]|nr:tRNA pseudouridine(54/55) synthase Pus10 [Methanomicrobiales archaeon]
MDFLDEITAILATGPLCDHCLGRFYGKRSHGLSNDERGRAIRITHGITNDIPFTPAESCWICGGLFTRTGEWADRAIQAMEGIEYASFLVGTKVPPIMAEAEEMVWSDLSLAGAEPLKAEMNREVGKIIQHRTGKEAEFAHPDVVAILDIAAGVVDLQINPLFITGRYRKFERGIPQTHWDCRTCRGKGCERCNFTGKQYQDSVEELIGRPVIAALEAENAVLHGAGREDIDARMLGTGRPFILEVVAPRKRSIDLAALEQQVNIAAEERVGVTFEGWSDRRAVETLKSKKANKRYRIFVQVDGETSPDELRQALARLNGAVIHQRTPQRVAHRRADKVRERSVVAIELVRAEDGRFLIEVVGEAGLYIKELITGDAGRTQPSLSGILEKNARVTSLDVVLVE